MGMGLLNRLLPLQPRFIWIAGQPIKMRWDEFETFSNCHGRWICQWASCYFTDLAVFLKPGEFFWGEKFGLRFRSKGAIRDDEEGRKVWPWFLTSWSMIISLHMMGEESKHLIYFCRYQSNCYLKHTSWLWILKMHTQEFTCTVCWNGAHSMKFFIKKYCKFQWW